MIPTQDRSQLLSLTLAAVRSQRDVDFEVIVVNDASTDRTAQMITRLGDRRIRLAQQDRPAGVSAARNRGIAEARGEWIAFLDDDDLWASQKLVRQLEAAKGSGCAWAYAGDVLVDAELRVLTGGPPPTPERVLSTLTRYNSVPSGGSNVVVRAEALAEAGPFDPTLRRTEDWDMWIRLARLGPPACVSLPLVAYRFHPGNVPVETSSIVREPDVLAERYGILVDRAAMQRRAAWASLRAGNRRSALRHYARAVSMGDIRSIGRAMVALVHPAVGSDRVFRMIKNRPEHEQWRRDAQGWLDDLLYHAAEGTPT